MLLFNKANFHSMVYHNSGCHISKGYKIKNPFYSTLLVPNLQARYISKNDGNSCFLFQTYNYITGGKHGKHNDF